MIKPNPIVLLISFSPWILFGVLAGPSQTQLELALLISLIASLVVGYKDLKKKMIVPTVTVIFFSISFVAIFFFHLYVIAPYLGMISNTVLTLISLGSLAAGMPWTSQYARLEVPEERWNDPGFIRINQVLTGFWGLLFLSGLIKSIYMFIYPGSLGIFGDAYIWISIIIGVVFTVKYPQYAKKRILNKSTGK